MGLNIEIRTEETMIHISNSATMFKKSHDFYIVRRALCLQNNFFNHTCYSNTITLSSALPKIKELFMYLLHR